MPLNKSCRTCKHACITEEHIDDYDGGYSQYWTCEHMETTDLDDTCRWHEPIEELDVQQYKERILELEYELAKYEEESQIDLFSDL